MGSVIRKSAAGLAVATFAFAAADAQASTISGALTISLNGQVAFDVPNGDSAQAMVIQGQFTSVNSFVNPTGAAPLGWSITSDLEYSGQTSSLAAFDKDTTTGFGGAGGLRQEYRANLGLFSIASFMADIIGATNLITGAGEGQRNFGGSLPIGWTIDNLALLNGGGTTTSSGDFTFTINPDANALAFLSVFDGFAGIADDLRGDREGGSFSAAFTTSPVVIPLPAAFPLLLGGVGMLSLMGWRRRQSQA